MSEFDWLSHLLQIVTVTGQLEVRCAYGATMPAGLEPTGKPAD